MQPDSALETHRPFTRAAALAAGITVKQLRGPAYRRLLHGVYVAADVAPSPRLRARAALLGFGRDAWLSHASAARVLGIPIPTIPDEHVTVVRRADRRSRRDVVCHLRAGGRIRLVDGLPVSDYAQLFVELAELLGLVDLVITGDHLVRHGHLSVRALSEFCRASTGRGAVAARRAASYVRERVDSPMETRLRMLLVLAGLPEPLVNITVTDAHGRPLRRYDLCYPAGRLAIEYDGRHHVERIEQWESDLDRRAGIDDDGWRLLVLVARDVYAHPHRTLARIHRLLKDRRVAGTPARLRDDWRAHFPAWA